LPEVLALPGIKIKAGDTPLHDTIKVNMIEMAAHLILEEADIHIRNNYGEATWEQPLRMPTRDPLSEMFIKRLSMNMREERFRESEG
jgi:hypothetical protein